MDGDFVQDVVVACAGDHTVRVFLNRSMAQPTATRPAQLAGLDVYPNPAADRLTVQRPTGTRGPLAATLRDALGRAVLRFAVPEAATTVPVGELPRGVYVLQVNGPAGTATQRVVLH
ncbi:hypothetical protein GCM10023186_42980 [Hymenobacter koreensis]|uniref:Secretion system C-terminal sorting domain-containing protein n=1 Tax=Hymenobacter koreensis TaxID=1084523 RepID=A0ABP8JL26_9BACT